MIRSLADQYKRAKTRNEKSAILDNAVNVLGCHRKDAIRVLANLKRKRPLAYQEAMPVIQRVWEALDYPCAERLHPVLLETAQILCASSRSPVSERHYRIAIAGD